jgi:aminoglycoside phosphotransferase family enzyme
MRRYFCAANIVTITPAQVVTAALSIRNTTRRIETVTNEYQNLLDDLEPIVAERAERNRAIVAERDRRLAHVAFLNDMDRLHDRIRRPNPAFSKACRDIEVMAKAAGLDGEDHDARIRAAAQQRQSDQRNAQAAQLKGILDRLDAAIAAGTIDAEGVAKIEARINRLAERIGVTP